MKNHPVSRSIWSSLGLICSAALLSTQALAQQDPWPFDFDPQIAADPAGIESRLDDLGDGVPPIPAGDLEPAQVGPVTLYFHADMVELLERAYDSGPGFQDYFQRVPALCAQHDAFVFPTVLASGASSSCQQTEQQIRAAFDDDGQSCLRIEFPELYVYDQPVGEAADEDLQSLEGLISIVGEVFTHMDYPTDLLPDYFEQTTRDVIAKVRYQTLLDNARARRTAYGVAKAQLQGSPQCFEPTASAALVSTIDDLIAELDAAVLDLETLYADGVAAALADRRAVEAQGRIRDELPYPALTDRERELIALYIGAIYWRMRGESLLDYNHWLFGCAVYVLYPYQVIADLCGGADGADIGRDIYIHETWGYADWMDIGHNPGNDKYSDMVDMAIRGKRTLDAAEPRLRERGYDTSYLYAGGLQMGPCYYYGWEPLWDPDRFFQLGEVMPDPYHWFLECPTAHGEFCTGGGLVLGLARTLLWGKPNSGCIPNCVDRDCGGDTCGGSCGSCDPGYSCELGVCAPVLPDAGWPDSASADARVSDTAGFDAGQADASTPDSAGRDLIATDTTAAGADRSGGGGIFDAGDSPPPVDEGCGCGLMADTGPSGGWLVLVLALLRRRARGARREHAQP